MAEDTKPISGVTENKRDTAGDQLVSVKALKSFHKNGDMTGEVVGPDSEPFEVSRSRAAQLRANGLIDYAKDADAVAIHGEAGSQQLSEKVRLQAVATKLPENSRTTPLRNPEVKLAAAKDA